MAIYKIKHREERYGEFFVEADSEEEAMDEYENQLNNGQIDFSDMEMINSSDAAFYDREEWGNSRP